MSAKRMTTGSLGLGRRAPTNGNGSTHASDSRAIARMDEPATLAPAQLEQRRLIHREASARRHSDAFREVRTSLLGMAATDNFITLVTAVSPRSGASFVARNLAAAFALDEARTSLLIDCNLRYPEQHEALSITPGSGGLADYLDAPEQDISSRIYATGIPRLRLIPAGNSRENSSEYMASTQMKTLLHNLRQRYPDRYLFLDAPPSKSSPDARILAELADLVVLVAAYGHDTPAAISQAAEHFSPDKFAGVVFNQPD